MKEWIPVFVIPIGIIWYFWIVWFIERNGISGYPNILFTGSALALVLGYIDYKFFTGIRHFSKMGLKNTTFRRRNYVFIYWFLVVWIPPVIWWVGGASNFYLGAIITVIFGLAIFRFHSYIVFKVIDDVEE